MQQQLAIVTADHQSDWDRHIASVLMAYHSAVQSATNCTPALLMLAREIMTAAELLWTHKGWSMLGSCRTDWKRDMLSPETSWKRLA